MWIELPIIFVAVTMVMAVIAEETARTFVRFEPLEAYRLDILGSLIGIGAFSVLAFVRAPPVAWGLVVAIAFRLLLKHRMKRRQRLALWGLILLLGAESVFPLFRWSPYYKLTVTDAADVGSTHIKVNGIPHPSIVSLSEIRSALRFYLLPYARKASPSPAEVLIIGPGAGNDVASARRTAILLMHAWTRVTASHVPRTGDVAPDGPRSNGHAVASG